MNMCENNVNNNGPVKHSTQKKFGKERKNKPHFCVFRMLTFCMRKLQKATN